MKIFSKIFIILIFSYLMAKCLIKEEINCGLKDTIDIRHHLIDSLYNHIDSLYREIDTLQQERNNMLENKKPPPQMDF